MQKCELNMECEFYNKGIEFKGDCAPDGYCLINYLLKTNGFDIDSIYCTNTPNCNYKKLLQNMQQLEAKDKEIDKLKAENQKCKEALKGIINVD